MEIDGRNEVVEVLRWKLLGNLVFREIYIYI